MQADDASSPSPTPPGSAASPFDEMARVWLADRKRERRWRTIWRLLWLLLATAVLLGTLADARRSAAPSGPHTALVEVRGVIDAEGEATADGINAALRSAFEDRGARAVVMRINSPGGSPVQAGLVYDEIQRLRKLHDKKLYAVCEELCASAAYYIAAAADEVVVDKASLVGSIGVLMDGFGYTGVMDKLGVERRLLTAGANKGFLDPFTPMSEAHRAYALATLDQIHQQFIEAVKAGRGERLKITPDTFSGLFWNGQSALEQGLVDRIGSLDQLAREVIGAEEIIDYTPKENLAERFARRFGAAAGGAVVEAMRGLPTLR
ncbi:S49 family peptidase [Piscinibacter sp. Jin2]|uniref:S49 family peptidase n=1 Tax=Aquariibacter lacus TaxID=2801332 RepID=A0A9X0XGS6_9BURK|nr:S49 family peptidase [Piscinibacter lacus]